LPDLNIDASVGWNAATGLAMAATIKPRAACLIGWPAAHSRSPLIHHYWLRTLGIEGGYNIEAVPPEGFAEFVMHLSAHGFVGANVTLPHKERALALTVPDARARAVGAANTLWYEGGELRSTNTDIEGFIDNLDACAKGWDAIDDALVLGAGGSSRAVVFGLVERGVKRVHLANRTVDRARALADQFGKTVHSIPWEAMPCRAPDFWSTPPRSACMVSPRLTSMSAGSRRMRSSPTSSMCRWKRRCSPPRAPAD
jgi:shikimate dehydrogenase